MYICVYVPMCVFLTHKPRGTHLHLHKPIGLPTVNWIELTTYGIEGTF